jgi:hypothetical protein
LIKKAAEIPDSDRENWEAIDAQLCGLLWNSISHDLLPLFSAYQTCYEVWDKA